jgi:phage-related protein
MKTLAAGLTTQATAAASGPVLLAEVAGWGGTTVRWAQSDAAVTYGGNAYAGRPFSVGAVSVNADGSPQRASLTLANQDLALSALCAAADPRGLLVTLRRTFLDNLAVAQTLASGLVIEAYRLTEDSCEFTLSGLAEVFKRELPRRTYDRVCPWVFKGSECAYAGGDATCDYTDDACKAKSNFSRFGGYLFVLPRRY